MARQTARHARLSVARHLRRLRHVVEVLVLVRGGVCNERVAAVAIGVVEVVPAQARQTCCWCGRQCRASGWNHSPERNAHGQGRGRSVEAAPPTMSRARPHVTTTCCAADNTRRPRIFDTESQSVKRVGLKIRGPANLAGAWSSAQPITQPVPASPRPPLGCESASSYSTAADGQGYAPEVLAFARNLVCYLPLEPAPKPNFSLAKPTSRCALLAKAAG